jgi:hypothetical protein
MMVDCRYLILLPLIFFVIATSNMVIAASIITPNAANSAISNQSTQIPRVEFLYIPTYITAQPGQSVTSQLTLKNTGAYAEYVNLSTDGFNNMLVLSTNSILIPSGQTISISVLFISNLTTNPGTYYIPIDALINQGNLNVKQTEFVTFNVQNQVVGKPYVSSQIVLTNNTNIATGTIEISNPNNKSIDNFTLLTTIITPQSPSLNISQIIAYGLDNNITIENNSYMITWYADNIPASKSIYAYYTITKPRNELPLSQIDEIFSPPVYAVAKKANLKITNVGIPVFYSNSTSKLTVTVLYTGSSAQLVNFSLTTLSKGIIYNGTQSVLAEPNQTLNRSFGIFVSNNLGTLVLNLSIMTKGVNISYTLPATVVPRPTKQASNNSLLIISAILGIAVILLIMYIFVYLRGKKKSQPEEQPKTKQSADSEKERKVSKKNKTENSSNIKK